MDRGTLQHHPPGSTDGLDGGPPARHRRDCEAIDLAGAVSDRGHRPARATLPGTCLRSEYGVSREDLDTVKNVLAPGASDSELRLLLATAKRLNLDPLRHQVHYVRMGENTQRGVILVGIDGLRVVAQDSGEYDGQDAPTYTYDKEGKLESATVTVYRKSFTRGVSATAFWSEYARPSRSGNGAWDKLPRVMLSKVAEASALRRAFPRGLSGVYEPSELDQARREGTALPPPTETPPPSSFKGEHHEPIDVPSRPAPAGGNTEGSSGVVAPSNPVPPSATQSAGAPPGDDPAVVEDLVNDIEAGQNTARADLNLHRHQVVETFLTTIVHKNGLRDCSVAQLEHLRTQLADVN